MTRRRNVSGGMAQITALALLLAANGMMAQSLGSAFTYQGQLKELGQPASGLYDLQACLFDTPSNPIPLACAPDFNDVPVEGGLFAITLDFGSAPFVGQQRFLELRVRPGASGSGYTILAPRQLIRPAPEALRSNVSAAAPWSGLTGVPSGFADGVDNDSGGTVTSIATGAGLTGGPITNTGSVAVAAGGIGATQINPAQVQSRVTGNCAAGLFVRAVNQDGTVVCDAAGVGSITGVTAGTGLTGGGTSGAVSLGIAPGGVGATQINAAQVQTRVTGSCAVGLYVRAVNQDGTVVCETDTNSGGTVTSITTGAGLTGGPITETGSVSVAPGGIGTTQINPAQVQTRVTGTCPLGENLRGVNADGSVICESLPLVAATQFTNVYPGGRNVTLAIGNDGLPFISYEISSENGFSLRGAKCINPACSGVATLSIIVSVNVERSAMAIGADNLPVLSYFDTTDFPSYHLKVAKCSNAACTGAVNISTVATITNQQVNGIAIAVGSDGLPVISYSRGNVMQGNALYVAKCSDAACSGSVTITTIDDPANFVGQNISIAIGSDGIPVLSYSEYGTNVSAVKVAKCANASCTGSASITIVDAPPSSIADMPSIAIGGDALPVFSYSNSATQSIKVAKCVNPACTGSATITTIDDPVNELSTRSSLAIGINGRPVISYGDRSTGSIKVAQCANAACTGLATITVVSNLVSAPTPAIAIGGDGLPVVSYDGTVAKCVTPSCQ